MKRLIVITLLLTHISGCSIFVPETQDLTVKCNARDPIIYARDIYSRKQEFRTNEITVRVPRDSAIDVGCEAYGYRNQEKRIKTVLSTTGKLDAAGILLFFPIIGLASPGAEKLQEDNVTFTLIPYHYR